MKKKLVLVLAMGAVAATALTGCGGAAGSAGSTGEAATTAASSEAETKADDAKDDAKKDDAEKETTADADAEAATEAAEGAEGADTAAATGDVDYATLFTNAMMGTDEDGNTFYYLSNDDMSLCGLYAVNSDQTVATRYIGAAQVEEVEGGIKITIEDQYCDGGSTTFTVLADGEKGSVIQLENGKGAVLANADVAETAKVMESVDTLVAAANS